MDLIIVTLLNLNNCCHWCPYVNKVDHLIATCKLALRYYVTFKFFADFSLSFSVGFALTGYVISSTQVPDLLDCSFACLQKPRCQSYNFQEVPGPPHLCELNNETIDTKPENYQGQADMTYYKPGKVCKKVSLNQNQPNCSDHDQSQRIQPAEPIKFSFYISKWSTNRSKSTKNIKKGHRRWLNLKSFVRSFVRSFIIAPYPICIFF